MSKPTYGEMRTRAQRISDGIVKDRVLTGLAALQSQYGDVWVEKIDCEKLWLADSSRCVLGQVCDDFEEGIVEMNDGEYDTQWAEDHGFYDRQNEYEPLQEAWTAVLCDKEAIPGAS